MSRTKKQSKAGHLYHDINKNGQSIGDYQNGDKLYNDGQYEKEKVRRKNNYHDNYQSSSAISIVHEKKNRNGNFAQFSLGSSSDVKRGSIQKQNEAKRLVRDHHHNRLIDIKKGATNNVHEISSAIRNQNVDSIREKKNNEVTKPKHADGNLVTKSLDTDYQYQQHSRKQLKDSKSVYKPRPALSFVNYRNEFPSPELPNNGHHKEAPRKRKTLKLQTHNLHSKFDNPNINEERGPTVRPYGVPFKSVNNHDAIDIAPYATAASLIKENADDDTHGNSVYDYRSSGGRKWGKGQSRDPKSSEISYLKRVRDIDSIGIPVVIAGQERYPDRRGSSKTSRGYASYQPKNSGYRVNRFSRLCIKTYHL